MKLTDLFIRNLRFDGTKTRYFDDAIPNFGVRVYRSGVSFVLMFGNDRRMRTIGKYPAMSLKEARIEALKFLGDDTRCSAAGDRSVWTRKNRCTRHRRCPALGGNIRGLGPTTHNHPRRRGIRGGNRSALRRILRPIGNIRKKVVTRQVIRVKGGLQHFCQQRIELVFFGML